MQNLTPGLQQDHQVQVQDLQQDQVPDHLNQVQDPVPGQVQDLQQQGLLTIQDNLRQDPVLEEQDIKKKLTKS